ncbi:[acyl-carrier-protein] S-malonyltransferase [Bacillus wiedmannii]|uniref:ACP S-malonyltransferase n=1 Tax=Bacillus wiedmannii TaxID=1890302 RepID=UPI000BF74AF3|nr:ACP S-malonyltransferase [Bacillus wiedmannii]PEP92267.1 [acyl-carrier-protein] S-malonyltransferase [Bacillus wiedmannii]
MDKAIVFLFSGQGSQFYHMGRELFEQVPAFRNWMLKLDEMMKPLIGESVLGQLYSESKGKSDHFECTLYTHPAIFMVEYALAQALIENGIKPNYVLGSSLGEFAAAAVANVMSVEEMLKLVVKQAQSFEAFCETGGMLGILHAPFLYKQNPLLHNKSELVSVNYDAHFVVSGKLDHLWDIQEFLRSEGIAYQKLPVSYAYHSNLIDPAASSYIEFLRTKSYGKPQVCFLSGMTGLRETKLPSDYFWNVVRKPIQSAKAVQELECEHESIYVDLSPAGTLASFVKRNLRTDSQSEIYTVITPFNQDMRNFNKVLENLSNINSFKSRREGENMKAYVFPGQGSQHKGMGSTLFDEFPDITAKADKILGYSIKELCLEDPKQNLGKTQYTQPALYVVNALSYLKKVKETGIKPDYVAGHSLGEYNALFAAGAFDFETGLNLVKKRGELMSQAVGGGMAAIIGFSFEQVNRVLMENGLDSIDIANHNSPFQIVITGQKVDIERAQPIFEEAGVSIFITLNVSGAFHSRYMGEAKRVFGEFLEKTEFSNMEIPVISNTYARIYNQDNAKVTLMQQITHPVKWTDSIRYLMGIGEIDIEEIGPGNVLTKLVVAIQRDAEPLVIEEEIEGIVVVEQADNEIVEEACFSIEECVSQSQLKVQEETFMGVEEDYLGINEYEFRSNVELESDIQPITQTFESKLELKKLRTITASSLGNEQFKKDYNLKYAYVTGSMYRGVASEQLVIKVGKAGMMGFYGTGGMKLEQIENAICTIQRELNHDEAYGMNLLHNQSNPSMEEATVDLFLRYGVKNVEASAYMTLNNALVRYRAKGLKRDIDGKVIATNRIIAKFSRPEVAEAFLSPAPKRIVDKLLLDNRITEEEAVMLRKVPMADDITVEADSGGHTDQGAISTLLPAMIRLRDEMMNQYGYTKEIRIGAAGGIGTPEAAVAAFMLGADYIVTGSINQCTVEASTSDTAKDLLQEANVQDTTYAPAGDMFEIGARVQVLKKGMFFPSRANKLYDLYRQYNSIEEIDGNTQRILQERYFKRNFDEVYHEVKSYVAPQEIEKAERNPKHKMALIFKWYFGYSSRMALSGNQVHTVDYQIHCGPALGAFNHWVKGTALENWRNRHVDEIGEKLMQETADLLQKRILTFIEA